MFAFSLDVHRRMAVELATSLDALQTKHGFGDGDRILVVLALTLSEAQRGKLSTARFLTSVSAVLEQYQAGRPR